jgi:hypothetical protein
MDFFEIGHAAKVVGLSEVWVQLQHLSLLLDRLVILSCQEEFQTQSVVITKREWIKLRVSQ